MPVCFIMHHKAHLVIQIVVFMYLLLYREWDNYEETVSSKERKVKNIKCKVYIFFAFYVFYFALFA